MEDFHRLFQLSARGGHRRREDLLLPWRPQPRPPEHGANPTYYETHGRAGSGSTLWSPLVRSGQGHHGLGRKRPWGTWNLKILKLREITKLKSKIRKVPKIRIFVNFRNIFKLFSRISFLIWLFEKSKNGGNSGKSRFQNLKSGLVP